MTIRKFHVRVNGDDAPVESWHDTYEEGEAEAKRLSLEDRSEFARGLGFSLWSERSGKIATFRHGACVGYLDANSGKWTRK